jgi:hypothetical protein
MALITLSWAGVFIKGRVMGTFYISKMLIVKKTTILSLKSRMAAS